MEHVFGLEDFVKLLFGEEFVFEDELVYTAASLGSLFGNFGRGLVTDDGVEHGDDADAVLNKLTAALLVGDDAVDAEGAEGVESVLQQVDALEEGVGDDGFHDVELELAVVAGKGAKLDRRARFFLSTLHLDYFERFHQDSAI